MQRYVFEIILLILKTKWKILKMGSKTRKPLTHPVFKWIKDVLIPRDAD